MGGVLIGRILRDARLARGLTGLQRGRSGLIALHRNAVIDAGGIENIDLLTVGGGGS